MIMFGVSSEFFDTLTLAPPRVCDKPAASGIARAIICSLRPFMITASKPMKPNGADKWSGEVYNAEDGKTYSGNITGQGANALRLEGCVMGFLCKGQTWTRGN
jgi:hypothetical protein